MGWDVWLCALGVLVLGWAVFTHGQARPDALRQLAESRINQSLAEAGYGWAKLSVDGSVAVLTGVAPDPISKTALASIAKEVAEPYGGVPGVFWRLDDRTRLNDVLPSRPLLPESEVDLLADLPAPGAGRASNKGPSLTACTKAFQTVQETRPLRFRPGAATLDRSASPVLQQLAALTLQCKGWRLVIQAPLDSTGPRRGEVALGERRAAAIAAALMVEGVPARQIEAVAQAPEAIERALAPAVAASAAAAAASEALAAASAVPPDATAARAVPRPASRNHVEYRLAALTAR
ncbi:OmpA family protein [Leptothrix discophora]|uniref:OmpA family protein n=1 Tax=Leptothrix discophora TaxID=89 RepID=UPI002737CAED|nr:OmpA family protein [Leptothrix discophora]